MNNKKQDPYYQAQNILSRRDHSEAEFRHKMRRKGFRESVVDEVVEWLYKEKLLNDKSFSLKYMESILIGKAVGPKWMAFKLKEKGVDNNIIEEVMLDIYSNNKEEQLAIKAAESWLRIHKTTSNQKEKLVRFLVSRGFSYQYINKAIQSLNTFS